MKFIFFILIWFHFKFHSNYFFLFHFKQQSYYIKQVYEEVTRWERIRPTRREKKYMCMLWGVIERMCFVLSNANQACRWYSKSKTKQKLRWLVIVLSVYNSEPMTWWYKTHHKYLLSYMFFFKSFCFFVCFFLSPKIQYYNVVFFLIRWID